MLIDDPTEMSEESEDENVQDADGEGTVEDLDVVDLANGKQPRWWKNAGLVVADPFILTKVSRNFLLSLIFALTHCLIPPVECDRIR